MTLGELLGYCIERLQRNAIEYAVVGSFASGIWGEPRMTRDIDIVLRLDEAQIEGFCGAFSEPQFYLSRTAVEEAVSASRPFNLIHLDSGNKIDFIVISESDWSHSQIDRRSELELQPGVRGYVAAPEDVILGKLVYYREGGSEKHLRDIAGILKVSEKLVDRDYVARGARDLGVADVWEMIVDAVGGR